VSSYYTGEDAGEFKNALESVCRRSIVMDGGSAVAVDLANRKDLMRGVAIELEVPVAAGEVVSWRSTDPTDIAHDLQAAVARHSAQTGGVMVRGVRTLRGLDNLEIGGAMDPVQLTRWLERRTEQPAFLVESLLTVAGSPNVQAWIEDDGASHVLAITDQRLDDNKTHWGNIYPHSRTTTTDAILSSALVLSRWLSRQGYRGPLGFDFLVCERRNGTGQDHYLAEINGRINCATYAIAAFERINQLRTTRGSRELCGWVSKKAVACRFGNFADLCAAAGDLLYRPDSSTGVVPYLTGFLPEGTISIITVAATKDEALECEARFVERIAP